jgi:hypothetical protein
MLAYLVAAMIAWAPLTPARLHGEAPEHARGRYQDFAAALVSVVYDAQEPALREGRARTAVELASVAFWESGFSEIVDEGRCAPGTCDFGIAWTLYQIHDGGGLTLDGPLWMYARDRPQAWLLEHADSVIRGPDMVQDRQLAARVALHLFRRSPWVWSTWSRARAHVAWWVATHPVTEGS